jgi:hypothetical protein
MNVSHDAVRPPTHRLVLLHAENLPGGARGLRSLEVPQRPSRLVTSKRRRPRLLVLPRTPGAGVVFESISMHNQRYLLMLLAGNAGAHLNGRRAGPVSLLRVRDEVETSGYRFFVSVHRASAVTAPEPRHLHATCPFCRLQIAAGTQVFSCSCGTVLHCEDERWPEEARLPCATLSSTCPNCRQAITFAEGLEWEPSL